MDKNHKFIIKCSIKEIQALIPDISNATASRMMTQLRYALNKPKPQIITMKDFEEYYNI